MYYYGMVHVKNDDDDDITVSWFLLIFNNIHPIYDTNLHVSWFKSIFVCDRLEDASARDNQALFLIVWFEQV